MWKIITGVILVLVVVLHFILGIQSSVSDDTLIICEIISLSTIAFGLDEVFRKKKQ